jgi:hypothetical protein
MGDMKFRRLAITCSALLLVFFGAGGAAGQQEGQEGNAQGSDAASVTGSVNSRISYQGMYKEDDAPVTGSRDMVFRLYSDDACSRQVGDDIVKNGVQVTGGLFSVELDVEPERFEGAGLWLEVEVATVVLGCQEILPVPYALGLRPGASIDSGPTRVEFNHYSLAAPPMVGRYYAALYGKSTGGFVLPNSFQYGVWGLGKTVGVRGESANASGIGVQGLATADSGASFGVHGTGSSTESVGVLGRAPLTGVRGHATATEGLAYGIHGQIDSSTDGAAAVYGHATATEGNSNGVYGRTDSNGLWARGVYGYAAASSGETYGVYGKSESSDGIGVLGRGDTGVRGETANGTAVVGDADAGTGVSGFAFVGTGVSGGSVFGTGVYGESPAKAIWGKATLASGYGVYAENTEAEGVGLYAVGGEGGYAAIFEGPARTQVLEITGGSDLAEPFEITGGEQIVPGLVVAIDPSHAGQLRIADKAYDRTVAGCVSGANGINPGLTLHQEGTAADGAHAVALSGRVYCWADAAYGAIQAGDLLTTSATPGHAMRVADYERAQGAIFGKAMMPLEDGRGLVLVLVSLQ